VRLNDRVDIPIPKKPGARDFRPKAPGPVLLYRNPNLWLQISATAGTHSVNAATIAGRHDKQMATTQKNGDVYVAIA
jgi:hypothetical protein